MGLLDGKAALVTGSGRGIGRGIAIALAAAGAKVVVNDLGATLDGEGEEKTPADQVVDEILTKGGAAVTNYGSVSDWNQAHQMVDQVVETFGKIDILVNVAGILRDRMIFNMTEAEWDAVVAVHLKGTFNCMQAASVYMRQQRSGRIISMSSVSALGAAGQPNYAAAKMGIVGLTWSSARALGKYGVTVNAISPGAATRMTDSVPTDRRRTRPEVDEWSPDNVAPIVAYLASERSGWITGRIIHSSGYEVSLYSNPEPVVRIVGTGPWQPDALAEQVERSFGPLLGRAR